MTYYSTQSGFSLVEMLVAVSVLLIVIVGPMTVTSRVAKSSTFATEQVQAFFLAQEGLELAEKMRDDYFLQHFNGTRPSPWADFRNTAAAADYNECYDTTAGCGVYWTNGTTLSSVVSCAPVSNCRLNYKSSATRSKYTHDTTGTVEPTPFTRVIKFENSGTTAVKVTSIVTWRTGSVVADQKVETSTYLYNTYDRP